MRRRPLVFGSAALLMTATAIFAIRVQESDRSVSSKGERFGNAVGQLQLPERGGMVRIPGGTFLMGSLDAADADARPPHRVVLDEFWLDKSPITNAQFAEFVAAAGYITTAERRGFALVFEPSSRAWQSTPGADWRHPHGPNSSIAGREAWPVVQVSWFDAMAYAHWGNKRLPTEAEYECAARGGMADWDYPWGRKLMERDQHYANYWQGRFPDFDQARDGHVGLAPTAAFPPNRYGLVDMLGNVYCWCADWYDAAYYDRGPARSPGGPAAGDQRVQRGGSWLSADNHEPLAVWRRRAADPSTATNHVGFRCASDAPPAASGISRLARKGQDTRE